MRRILYLTVSLFLLGGCAAELVDPDYQEDDYEINVDEEPQAGSGEQPVKLDPLRDPVLSNADGEQHGPSPYPWLAAQESTPSGPTPYPWEGDQSSSSGSGNGSGTESEGDNTPGAEPNSGSGSEGKKPNGG